VTAGFRTDSDAESYDTWVSVREQNAQGGFDAERLYGAAATRGLGRSCSATSRATAALTSSPTPGALIVLENEAPPLGTRRASDRMPVRERRSERTRMPELDRDGRGAATRRGDREPRERHREAAGERGARVRAHRLRPGNATIAAVNYGDGLRCSGGALKRLFSRTRAPVPSRHPVRATRASPRDRAKGDPLSAGSVRVYQAYYRDPNSSFCPMPTGSTFNVTSR
jgi:hypothetical protein